MSNPFETGNDANIVEKQERSSKSLSRSQSAEQVDDRSQAENLQIKKKQVTSSSDDNADHGVGNKKIVEGEHRADSKGPPPSNSAEDHQNSSSDGVGEQLHDAGSAPTGGSGGEEGDDPEMKGVDFGDDEHNDAHQQGNYSVDKAASKSAEPSADGSGAAAPAANGSGDEGKNDRPSAEGAAPAAANGIGAGSASNPPAAQEHEVEQVGAEAVEVEDPQQQYCEKIATEWISEVGEDNIDPNDRLAARDKFEKEWFKSKYPEESKAPFFTDVWRAVKKVLEARKKAKKDAEKMKGKNKAGAGEVEILKKAPGGGATAAGENSAPSKSSSGGEEGEGSRKGPKVHAVIKRVEQLQKTLPKEELLRLQVLDAEKFESAFEKCCKEHVFARRLPFHVFHLSDVMEHEFDFTPNRSIWDFRGMLRWVDETRREKKQEALFEFEPAYITKSRGTAGPFLNWIKHHLTVDLIQDPNKYSNQFYTPSCSDRKALFDARRDWKEGTPVGASREDAEFSKDQVMEAWDDCLKKMCEEGLPTPLPIKDSTITAQLLTEKPELSVLNTEFMQTDDIVLEARRRGLIDHDRGQIIWVCYPYTYKSNPRPSLADVGYTEKISNYDRDRGCYQGMSKGKGGKSGVAEYKGGGVGVRLSSRWAAKDRDYFFSKGASGGKNYDYEERYGGKYGPYYNKGGGKDDYSPVRFMGKGGGRGDSRGRGADRRDRDRRGSSTGYPRGGGYEAPRNGGSRFARDVDSERDQDANRRGEQRGGTGADDYQKGGAAAKGGRAESRGRREREAAPPPPTRGQRRESRDRPSAVPERKVPNKGTAAPLPDEVFGRAGKRARSASRERNEAPPPRRNANEVDRREAAPAPPPRREEGRRMSPPRGEERRASPPRGGRDDGRRGGSPPRGGGRDDDRRRGGSPPRGGGRDDDRRRGSPPRGGRDDDRRRGGSPPRGGGRDDDRRRGGSPPRGGRDDDRRRGSPPRGGRDDDRRRGSPPRGGRDDDRRRGSPPRGGDRDRNNNRGSRGRGRAPSGGRNDRRDDSQGAKRRRVSRGRAGDSRTRRP